MNLIIVKAFFHSNMCVNVTSEEYQ